MQIRQFMSRNEIATIQSLLGDAATFDDALQVQANLVASGWENWDHIDIPDDVFFAAVAGKVPGPNDD